MNLKSKKVKKYWGENYEKIDYTQMDQSIIKEFQGNTSRNYKKLASKGDWNL